MGRSARLRADGRIAPGADEADLLARAATADQTAFRVLVERHAGVLQAQAARLLGPAGEADDVVQEAYLRLWRNAAGIRVEADGVRPWLRRVVRNLAIDRLRQRRSTVVTDEVPEVAEPARQMSGLADEETAQRIQQALATLPERQRVAIVLFHFEEASQGEIATTLGLSQDAVESLLARGRRKLKEVLREEWRALIAPMDDFER